MSKVIMFGTGNLSKLLEVSMNKKTEVILYADNDKTKWNKTYNGKLVINPNDIYKYSYDYILIGSQYNEEIYNQLLKLNVEKSRIFQYTKFVDNNYDYVEFDINRALKSSSIVETLVTGNSYTKAGFDESMYNKNAINLARASQDLYFDYNLVKYVLENAKFSELKEVIIGLSYYSFEYDMSLSAMKNKVISYYNQIKLKHNINNIEKLMDGIDISNEIAKDIFDYVEGTTYIRLQWNDEGKGIVVNDDCGKKQAEIDCRKDYPDTVKENTEILKKYLDLLKANNINSRIVVLPVSKYYAKYFSSKIYNEFINIINELHQQYDFEYEDYFKSDLFEDEDFKDVSHLNPMGAKKFTELLNR